MMSVAIPRALAQDVRSDNLFSKRGSAVLDAPEPERVPFPSGKRRAAVSEMPLRRDASYSDRYTDNFDDDSEFERKPRRGGLRLSVRGVLFPKTLWGRIGVGMALLILVAGSIAGMLAVRSYLLHDEHFTVPDSAAIQIAGNSHMSRAQLLSVFGEDVGRNVFRIPLAQRRAELESLPWVAHATVMRLLPNRVRVAIVERTPVAFVREGPRIGLVDAGGVLLNMAAPDMSDGAGSAGGISKAANYSFPVLTGISAADPLAVRAARMKTYLGFLQALDATGEHLSQRVSEVDLSDPEDVRAIISSGAAGSAADKGGDILVHFGDEDFLERYRRYQAHLAEWRTQYPRLAAVDLRYERQAVLEMQPGAVAPPVDDGAAANEQNAASASSAAREPAAAVKPAAAATKAAAVSAAKTGKAPIVAKAKVKPAGSSAGKSPIASSSAKPIAPLTTAYPVTPLGAKLGGKPSAANAAAQGAPR
jgi:cell division protein FtsQ